MSYQALYRVFRPQRFEDVVGQEHITKTLQNALLQKKFSHAYLFSEYLEEPEKPVQPKYLLRLSTVNMLLLMSHATNVQYCKGITNGSISDVIEIDAASNNGVDEIRDIRDKVKFAPSVPSHIRYIS
nr:hypothetical protein P5621_00090 [Bacillus subtilis]